jgi:hypothetical protein
MENKPNLQETEFAILMAEGATGCILNTDGTIYQSDEKEIYIIFTCIDLANKFITEKQSIDNTIDFSIFNNKYELINFHRATKWQIEQ